MNNTSEQRERERERELRTHRERERETDRQTDIHTDRQRQRETRLGGEQTKQFLDFTECYVNQRTDTNTYRHGHTDTQTYKQLVSSWVFASCEPHKVTSRRITEYKLVYASSNQKSLNYKSKAGS